MSYSRSCLSSCDSLVGFAITGYLQPFSSSWTVSVWFIVESCFQRTVRTKRDPVSRSYLTVRFEAHLSPSVCHVSLLITHSSQVCAVVALDVYFSWSFKTRRRIQRCLAFQRRAERLWRARPFFLRAMLSSTSILLILGSGSVPMRTSNEPSFDSIGAQCLGETTAVVAERPCVKWKDLLAWTLGVEPWYAEAECNVTRVCVVTCSTNCK